ncbi:hypothetical protein ACFVX6_40870, partial [Streptomyces sp. NPDC058289]|uniref:hypothetical protein n=1 Tax=Streptomyces sp. NPDC058289 TaxID=3346425 RepID=UPI0036F01364
MTRIPVSGLFEVRPHREAPEEVEGRESLRILYPEDSLIPSLFFLSFSEWRTTMFKILSTRRIVLASASVALLGGGI